MGKAFALKVPKIELFWGDTLYQRDAEIKPLISNYLYERDVVMLLGSEKAGKSILGMQMAAHLSSGTPFLNKYPCVKTAVLYLQLEGKKDETAARLENISKDIPIDPLFFYRCYKKFLPLDISEYREMLRDMILFLPIRPKVIFIDCLYMAMSGDLIDNGSVRKFLGALSEILEEFEMACVLIHHEKKKTVFEGETIEMGDNGSYGSVFLRAFVDHILFLNMCKDKTRTLTCDTQRSGTIAAKEHLVLVQPEPLFFKVQGSLTATEETLYALLKKAKYTKDQLCVKAQISESTAERCLRVLVNEMLVNVVDRSKSAKGQLENVYGIIPKLEAQND